MNLIGRRPECLRKQNNSGKRVMVMGRFAIVALLLQSACAPAISPFDQDGWEAANLGPGYDIPSPEGSFGAQTESLQLAVKETTVLRYLVNNVLEARVTIPVGSKIEIPANYEILNINFRKPDGSVTWSSTGFVTPVRLLSLPASSGGNTSDIDQINQTQGGLYVSASVLGDLQGVTGEFPALKAAEPGSDFLISYEPSGKPKFSFTNSIKKRFGDRVNAGVDPAKQSSAERVKWQRIFAELKRATDRTITSPKAILMIDQDLAVERSIAFEKTGVISPNGAWTIAVKATAPRHGFPNVPCAEFTSEVIRQAYQRAGYRLTDDFNEAKKNRLIWSETAAVVNLSKALNTAGWVPWDTTVYRPITGSILMNAAGNTPGHAYMSGGEDGRLIVDNGSPQGRDLRKTSTKIIKMMYQTGVFFLPPGINPPKWL